MVIVHVAHIDTSVIGGVQFAVPKMVRSQSRYADVCLLNTCGDRLDDVPTARPNAEPTVENLPAPYNTPDIVVFHEVYRFEYIAMYRTLVKRGIPYVILPHGCLSKQAQKKKRIKKIAANLLFFNGFIRHARAIQYLSDSEMTMSAFPRYPSAVMGNGVALPAVTKTSFEREPLQFVYVGRLDMQIKGLDLLLAAVKKSETAFRAAGATLAIYGPDYGGAHEALVSLIRKYRITDLVRVGREQMGAEKQSILLSATCFVQASRTEGLPLGPLEALSYGLPCIVTRGVGLGGMIEAYGAGYQSETTAEGISKAMERFLQSRDRLGSMSRSAVRLIRENFDAEVIARETVEGYSRILN